MLIDAPGVATKNPAKARAGFYGVPYVARVEEAFNRLKNPQAAHTSAVEKARVAYAQSLDEQAMQTAALTPHGAETDPSPDTPPETSPETTSATPPETPENS